MLSPVGWLPLKSTPQARMRSSISSTILQMRLPRAGRTHLSASTPSPPIISVVSAKSVRPPCLTTWSVTQPVALLCERPEVVSDVPQLTPNRSLLTGTSWRRSFVSSLSISMPMRVALAVASIAPPSSRMLIASTRFPVLAISWAISSAVQPSSRWWSMTMTAPALAFCPCPTRVSNVRWMSGPIWQRPSGWVRGTLCRRVLATRSHVEFA